MESLTGFSFGELLNDWRRRSRLTQSQLAAKLGVHRNTIGTWERGEFLPDTKGMVLELARHLQLSESETRQLLEASLTGLSPAWNVPYTRNSFFTGREALLETLHKCLSGEAVVALTQSYALSGLGGVGKTQLAVEYSYRYSLSYSAVFWIAAENTETILHSFGSVAERLQLPERQDADQEKIVATVQRWLSTHSQWLLVFDNVEDLALLQRFLPAARAGAVLLTTRRQSLGTLAHSLELSELLPSEGLLLLLRRAKKLSSQASQEELQQLAEIIPAEYQAASRLVAAMDGLPLALDQAGAYIEETSCSVRDYLKLFETRQGQLLSRRGEVASAHPASVVATWSLSFEKVEQASRAAADLLRMSAFLHPDAIPEELFTEGTAPLSSALQQVASDPLAFDEAVRVLLLYSLIRRNPATATFSIHRLVQAVLVSALETLDRQQWQAQVIRAIHAAFPEHARSALAKGERLLPHALKCVPWVESEPEPTPAAVSLLQRTGVYLRERGQYSEAEPLLERVLCLREQHLGSEHPHTAESLNDLATLYRLQGKYSLAEPLYQRALAIREQHLEPEHPHTAESLNDLATLYWQQGKYSLAEPLYQRALAIREQHLGPEHPHTAESLNDLALLFFRQGKYSLAEPLFLRALAIREQHLGPEHPDTGESLNDLAIVFYEQGKYSLAEPLYQRAISIHEQHLGETHPETAVSLNNLATLYRRQGKYSLAEPLYQRAISIHELHLGPEHPETAISLNNLASLYRLQGKYSLAEPLYQRALAIHELHLGETHPHTVVCLNNLATLYRLQGKYSLAEPLYQRAISIGEQHLGETHPFMARSFHGLAFLYQVQDNYAEAEVFFLRALAIRERTLTSTHPELAETLFEFAILRQKQGRLDEARSLYQRTLSAQTQTLGPEHPDTTQTRERLAALLQSVGEREEAAQLEEG